MKILATEQLILGVFDGSLMNTEQMKSQLGVEVGLKQFLLIGENCQALPDSFVRDFAVSGAEVVGVCSSGEGHLGWAPCIPAARASSTVIPGGNHTV